MPIYTSHIYAIATQEMIATLNSDPRLSPGLFCIRSNADENIDNFAQGGLPKEGLAVVREVCNPKMFKSSHDEVKTHKKNDAPIISWLQFRKTKRVQVIKPHRIPTWAFGEIDFHKDINLAPPIKFLHFLKSLSIEQESKVVFYHHYTAYGDRLADAEYAWVFGKQDSLYIRHIDEQYRTVQFTPNKGKNIAHVEHTKDQPILHIVMNELNITLSPPIYRPYFYNFNWNDYKV